VFFFFAGQVIAHCFNAKSIRNFRWLLNHISLYNIIMLARL
jgi:hypothetical protein